jgi:para-nitrobenzyl esterase
MVWLAGGGFTSGGGNAPVFDGEALARQGVVVVTTNYRLGVLGFFAHPELTLEAKGEPTGNFGLLDQTAALRWVHRNIASFGGDPNRVTIFGQSAGATSVLYQMVIPSARGLFQRAIGESSGGTGGVFALDHVPTLPEAEGVGSSIARSLGAASLSQLRDLPPDRFLSAMQNEAGRPMIDGRLVLDAPDVLLNRGRQNDVPLLTGSNADDGNEIPRNFTDAYLAAFPNTSAQQANVDAMAWRVLRWADLHTKTARSKAYVYYFTRPAPPDAPAPGAYHGAELPYVFRNIHLINMKWSETDRELEQAMSSYWIRFAATGDPNQPGLPHWSPYNPAHRDRVMLLGDDLSEGQSRLTEPKIRWFDEYRKTLQAIANR